MKSRRGDILEKGNQNSKDAVIASHIEVDSVDAATVRYRTIEVKGLEIFWREAGDRNNPAILLLHGFPASSHMFRDLIPKLAGKYHLVAPDYPAFGQSST